MFSPHSIANTPAGKKLTNTAPKFGAKEASKKTPRCGAPTPFSLGRLAATYLIHAGSEKGLKDSSLEKARYGAGLCFKMPGQSDAAKANGRTKGLGF